MMRQWLRMVVGGLMGRPLIAGARREPAGGPPLLWARWALTVGAIAAVVAGAAFAVHVYGGVPANLTSGAPTGGSTAGSGATSAYGPLVSRGKPVSCSRDVYNAGGPNAITSGKYGAWSFWQASVNKLPSWCAVHIGSGPKRLLVAWTSDYTFDYTSVDAMTPRDYTLAVSADSTDGSDGHWQTVVTVKDNITRVRESVVPFAGMSWIKMTVTRAQAKAPQPFVRIDQIDAYDVSANLNGAFLFQGDSITVLSYLRLEGTHPTFDELAHQQNPRLFPTMLCEGLGGWNSASAAQHIDNWLALNPDVRYWLLGWGTNDALQMVAPSTFHDHLQFVITRIKAAGHVPVLAHIPAMRLAGSRGTSVDAEVRALNAQIDLLTRANNLIPGPDLYTLTEQHLDTYLGGDGIHPNHTGAIAMNKAWYDAMRDTLEATVQ